MTRSPSPLDGTDTWTTVLDELERSVERHSTWIADVEGASESELPLAFVAPVGLPAMPETVRARATDLQRRIEQLAARTRELRDAATPTVPAAARHRQSRSTQRSTFDQRA